MNIIIFIVILLVLILAHEFGHFIVAKKAGLRVDEFGVGFPPKIWGKKKGETEYTINWLPFGGFVRIFGEQPDAESLEGPDANRSLVNASKWKQGAVIAAGVVFNIILAWLLISVGYMIGLPSTVSGAPAGANIQNPQVTVVHAAPDSPAQEAGLQSGDKILSVSAGDTTQELDSSEELLSFIETYNDEEITVSYKRGDELLAADMTPEAGIVPERKVIGISTDVIGIATLPVHRALWEGGKLTASLTETTAIALAGFFTEAVTGQADLDQVAGPVGIVGLVGDASALGFVYLLTFTALISIHLAIINLIPFPALDGGRLLFLIIESIKGSPIRPAIANFLNMLGFVLLIILMLIITYNDIIRATTL